MNFWKKLFNKRKDKHDTKEIKRPENSYDIYNQNETLTLQTEIEKDLIAYEDEEVKNTLKTFPIELEKEVEKEMESENKNNKNIDYNVENSKSNNTYFVYEKNDKNGKNIGWQVKKENASKASKTYKTKEQTIEFVKNKATNEDLTCIIQNTDGSIDETIVFKAKNNK